ncbi:MAG: VOC family protein [Pseudohongiellaceae bacterium]
MLGYVTVGTNDIEKAAKFYDELLAGIGAKRFMEMDTFIAWSNDPAGCGFSITKPFDKNPASVGNGVMVAFMVDSTDKVDALHAKALELGGTDEGAPGARSDNFYGGYFRDLDGNKANFFCMT